MATFNSIPPEYRPQLAAYLSRHFKVVGDCWEWIGKRGGSMGYGGAHFKYSHDYSHRLMYALVFGEIPEGLNVLHHCDNPPCMRPSHLFLGTQADNVNDMISKGRLGNMSHPRPDQWGEGSPRSKLTADKVREIRRRYDAGEKGRALAQEFGIHFSTHHKIVSRQIWRHI